MNRSTTAALVILLGGACTSAPLDGSQEQMGSLRSRAKQQTARSNQPTDFYGMLRMVRFNYQQLESLEDLTAESTVVAVGRLSGIKEGKVAFARPDAPGSMRTVVAEFQVGEIIKGPDSSAESLYVSLWKSQSTSIEAMRSSLPNDRILVFLDEAQKQEVEYDARKGVPDGEVLYELASPQGMVAESAGMAVDVLELEAGLTGGSFENALASARSARGRPSAVPAAPASADAIARRMKCVARLSQGYDFPESSAGGDPPVECQ